MKKIERDGFTITPRLEADDCGETPWQREDGHGPVSDWTTRDKLPGERVLIADRGSKRYYNFAEAVRIARADGWGDGKPVGSRSAKQYAADAAKDDFRRLSAWCNDQWSYVGVVLSISRAGVVLDDHAASLWGIESDAGEYLQEVAEELVDEALEAGRAVFADLVAS